MHACILLCVSCFQTSTLQNTKKLKSKKVLELAKQIHESVIQGWGFTGSDLLIVKEHPSLARNLPVAHVVAVVGIASNVGNHA